LLISVVTTVWFSIGCWNDLVLFFRRLRRERVVASDDGTVAAVCSREKEEAVLPKKDQTSAANGMSIGI
jgi:hypothetical protein